MNCILLGLMLNCLVSPAPPTPEARRALLAPYQSYIATERPDGLHVVIFLLPTAIEIPAPVFVPTVGPVYAGSARRVGTGRAMRGRRR